MCLMTSQNKKRKNIKGAAEGQDTRRNNILIASPVNLTFVPKNTWWVDSGATTHISVACGADRQRNLISISGLNKFGFSCSFENNKVSFYQNSNVVGYGSLIDNLYILNIDSSHNEILKTGSQGIKRKLIENSTILWHKHLRIQKLMSDEILEPLDLSNFEVCVKYDYLYLIHEKFQSLDVFKSFKAEKIKVIKSNRGGEYYGRYDISGKQCLGPFALFLKECEIVLQYTMLGKPSMNGRMKENWIQEQLAVILLAMLNALKAVCFMIPLQDPFVEMGMQDFLRKLRDPSERRHAIPNDYIVFLHEHEDDIGLTEDDIGLTEDDPIKFCQIDAMKDEMKSMQDNDIWDLVKLSKGVKPIGCKWILRMDVKTAFLNGDIDETIYMVQPENCVK
ncbi:hypothetical protein CR513_04432, partial [Mucuna pruriens]